MASRFVAPKRLETLEDVRKALQLVQEQFDANGISRARGQLVTTSTTLAAGEFVRISPRQGATLVAKLPKASADNIGAVIGISLERPNGTLRISAQAPDTVVGVRATNYTTAGLITLQSNGVDAWLSTSELPSTSPGAAALDAQYVLGAAHPSLPSAAVATDSAEIDVQFFPGSLVTWALNTASVAFNKLANLTGLSVLGRAGATSGVMAAITATAARQVLQVNSAGTSLAWGNPIQVLDTGITANALGFHSVNFVNGTETTATVSDSGGGVASVFYDWNGATVQVNDVTYLATTRTFDFNSSNSILPVFLAAVGTEANIAFQRAALTGVVTASQDGNSTDWGAAPGLSVLMRSASGAGIPDWESATAARQMVRTNDAGTALVWGFPCTALNSAGADQGNFFSIRFNDGASLTSSVAVASGLATISYAYVGNTQEITAAIVVAAVGTINIGTLTCGGTYRVTSASSAFNIAGFTAKPVGFWFHFYWDEALTDSVTFLDESAATLANSIRCPRREDMNPMAPPVSLIFIYGGDSRWHIVGDDKQMIGVNAGNSVSVTSIGIASIQIQTTSGDVDISAGGDLVINADSVDFQSGLITAKFQESSSPTNPGAGFGRVWLRNDAPTQLMVRDDENADWPVGYAANAFSTTLADITNATTVTTPCTFTIPANTLRAGSTYRACLYVRVDRGATLTALTLTSIFRVAAVQRFGFGATVNGATDTRRFLNAAASFSGFVMLECYFTVLGTGAAAPFHVFGTLQDAMTPAAGAAPVLVNLIPQTGNTLNTAATQVLDFQVAWSAAVANVRYRVMHAAIQRVC